MAGSPHVGRVLTAVPRTWSPAPVTLHFQWYRVDSRGHRVAIARATGTTHRLTSADRGWRVQVLVTATKPGHVTGAAWSTRSAVVGR